MVSSILTVVVLPLVPVTRITWRHIFEIFSKTFGSTQRATSPLQVAPEPRFKIWEIILTVFPARTEKKTFNIYIFLRILIRSSTGGWVLKSEANQAADSFPLNGLII